MARDRGHSIAVVLGDDRAAIQDQQAIGMTGTQELIDRLAHTVEFEFDASHARECDRDRGDPPAPAHRHRRYEFADVLERVAVPGGTIPVLMRYERTGGRAITCARRRDLRSHR